MRFPVAFCLLFNFMAFAQPGGNANTIYKERLRPQRVTPAKTHALPSQIPEGSGLAAWNNQLWTHNDSGENNLYALDTFGNIITVYHLPRTINNDWEDLAQDSIYFYLADTGNNAGNRNKLYILRIDKQSLLLHQPVIDSITFTWPATVKRGRPQSKNYDCEALAAVGDSLLLFTKEWKKGRQTRIFSIPKTPGTYEAGYKYTLKTKIIITGASWQSQTKELALCGHNFWLRPHILIFPQSTNGNFYFGSGQKMRIRRAFRQVEGLASFNGKQYFLINENFKFLFLHTGQELHSLEIPKN